MGPKISVASCRVVLPCRRRRRQSVSPRASRDASARARVAFLIYQVWRFLLSGPVTPSRVDRDCAIHASLPLSPAGSRSQDQRSWDGLEKGGPGFTFTDDGRSGAPLQDRTRSCSQKAVERGPCGARHALEVSTALHARAVSTLLLPRHRSPALLCTVAMSRRFELCLHLHTQESTLCEWISAVTRSSKRLCATSRRRF